MVYKSRHIGVHSYFMLLVLEEFWKHSIRYFFFLELNDANRC